MTRVDVRRGHPGELGLPRGRTPATAAATGAVPVAERRGDDVALLEVAVRRGPLGPRARRRARRRRRPRRRPGPPPRAARSCGCRLDPLAQPAPGRVGRRPPARRSPISASSSDRSSVEVATPLVLVLQRLRPARTARRSPGAGRPRSRAARPGRRVDVEAEQPGDPRAAGAVGELGLAGVGRVRPRLEPRGSPGSGRARPGATRSRS